MTRSEKRDLIFTLLFENLFNNYSLKEIKNNKAYIDEKFIENFDDFIENYFNNIHDNVEEIDELIKNFSVKWKKERLSKMAIVVLRMSIYELLYEKEIPPSVVISEAVKLSKKYGADNEYMFINGILGNINRQTISTEVS